MGKHSKRGKSVGKRVQHTPPTGTTLTEFRRFLNTDVGTLRMNAKSTHTFAPLTVRLRNWLINKEKSRFEAGCGAKWPICANLPVYNRLNWLGFSLLMDLLAPQ